MLAKILRLFGLNKQPGKASHQNLGKTPPRNLFSGKVPEVLSRSGHTLSRRDISPYALKVLYRLHNNGFEAYLVGGGVRDVLCGQHPKDFDVVTNAEPNEVAKLFKNSRLIGRRFRIVHVHFGGHIVEVTTFRATAAGGGEALEDIPPTDIHQTRKNQAGMLVRDNVYGSSIEEDVLRRDFTVNALYYNIADFSITDYVGGLADLKAGVVRIIGNAAERYREDPVRMLRAIRFAAKLKFKIDEETGKPILALASLLEHVPQARLFDEYIKLFLKGHGLASFHLLQEYQLFPRLFPSVAPSLLLKDENYPIQTFLTNALMNTDDRIRESKTIAPFFLLAIFLWYPIKIEENKIIAAGGAEFSAFYDACDKVFNEQQRALTFPRRFSQMAREVLNLQLRLKKNKRARIHTILSHSRFRAAYDFLLLRAEAGELEAKPQAEWWKQFVESDEKGRAKMLSHAPKHLKKRAALKPAPSNESR